MEGMNKFQVLTAIVVFMFVFAVAAMYTNTKEASEGKAQAQKKEQAKEDINLVKTTPVVETNGANNKLSDLEDKVDNLSSRIADLETNSRTVCRIYGIRTSNGVEELSAESAVSEAKNNNAELVLTCSF
jgi:TolA-binding protein